MSSLTQMIKELTLYFSKYHFEQYLEDKKITKIPDNKIKDVVDLLYVEEKKKELREYIRSCLKETLKENYNSFTIENILLEMFNDEELSKNRIVMEIKEYQKSKI
jgi:hypothetical protein